MDIMTACCGLDCATCDARLATIRDDRELREKTARLWSELNHVTIRPDDIHCEGCRAGGVKTVYCESLCGIRQCALGKGLETCGGCPSMDDCPTLAMVTASNAAARANLERARRGTP